VTRSLRLDIEYDGAGFAGWAAQPGLRTCEEVLGDALHTLLGHETRLRVAGRTDAGVHATGQVASITTDTELTCDRIRHGLAGILPRDIAVRAVTEMPVGFDARRDASARRYEYRLLTGAPSPLRRAYTMHVRARLDLDALDAAAALVVGQHDFRAFTPTQTQHTFFHRTVSHCRWDRRGDELVLEIEANAFLRGMVRALVGTMLMIGRRREPAAWMAHLLAGAPRAESGPAAPACGLTLAGVRYE
jgi:tRNA pseudouridine38-40 synthase